MRVTACLFWLAPRRSRFFRRLHLSWERPMKRIVTAFVLIAVVFAVVFLGQLWMVAVLAALIAELAAFEYIQLANAIGLKIPIWWMAPATALVFVAANAWPSDTQLPLLTALGFLLFGLNGFLRPLKQVLPETAAGLFGLAYIAYPLSLLAQVWSRDDGKPLVLFLMVCVWAGDIAALYIGKNFGRRKLAPRLSPGKTWEGTVASLAGSLLAGAAVFWVGDMLSARGNMVLHIEEPLWQVMLLAVVLNLAAQLGDLLESAIKRGAAVKDSGTLLPGHGGVLDRIDALLLAAPVLWYCLLAKDWLHVGRF
jgi:phosphatidate cytidylyltransferase